MFAKLIAKYIGWLNFLIFQWAFVRLAKVIHVDVDTYEESLAGFHWMVGVVPLTGWHVGKYRFRYRYVGGQERLRKVSWLTSKPKRSCK